MKLSDLKEFPILGARDQRELVDEETWKAWMRSKGAYVAKIAPYNSRFAVMFGEENYVNVCRDLFSLEMSQHMEGAGGLVTVPGMVDFDYMLHTVFLPENTMRWFTGTRRYTWRCLRVKCSVLIRWSRRP